MTKESISSRIKITKTGKLLRRKMGLGHFHSKQSAQEFRRKEHKVGFKAADRKVLVKMFGLTK